MCEFGNPPQPTAVDLAPLHCDVSPLTLLQKPHASHTLSSSSYWNDRSLIFALRAYEYEHWLDFGCIVLELLWSLYQRLLESVDVDPTLRARLVRVPGTEHILGQGQQAMAGSAPTP